MLVRISKWTLALFIVVEYAVFFAAVDKKQKQEAPAAREIFVVNGMPLSR